MHLVWYFHMENTLALSNLSGESSKIFLTKTIAYNFKLLTRRSLVLYYHVARPGGNRGAPAEIAVSALQYAIPKYEKLCA